MQNEKQKYDDVRMRCLIAARRRAFQREKRGNLLPPGVLSPETVLERDDVDTISSICTSIVPEDLSEEGKLDLIAELVHRLEILYPDKAVLRVPSFFTRDKRQCQASSTS